MDAYKVSTFPFSINVEVVMAGFNIDNVAANKAFKDAKTRWLTLRLIFADTFLEDYYFPDAGMEHCDAWAAMSSVLASCWSSTYEGASDVSLFPAWFFFVQLIPPRSR